MDINHMREFIVFAKHLNVSAAAKELFISTSGLSKHLKEIEDEIGVPLIKHDRRFTLTPAGESFLEACFGITYQYDNAIQLCRKRNKSVASVLKVSRPIAPDLGSQYLYRALRRAQTGSPPLDIRLIAQKNSEFAKLLESGAIDCGLFHSPLPQNMRIKKAIKRGVILTPLFQEEIKVILPSFYVPRSKDTISLEEIENLPIYVPSTKQQETWRSWITELLSMRQAKPLFNPKNIFDIDDFFNLDISSGIILVTSEAETNPILLSRTDLTVLPLGDRDISNTVYLAYLEQNENPGIKLLEECLRDVCMTSGTF